MKLSIRDADLDSDREVLISTLFRYLTPFSDDCRFDWLYRGNRDCVAIPFLATDTETGRVIGAAAAFPRRFYFGRDEVSGLVLGDFCLDAQFRSLGPALQLQRACLGVMDAHSAMFCYDFPSASMVAVYKRLGIAITGRILRLAKLLSIDRKIREFVKLPLVETAVSALGNKLLKTIPVSFRPDGSVEMRVHVGLCGEEFSILDRDQRGRLGICARRSTEYLNWRYVNNPLTHYEILTARRSGALKGYAVWTQAGDHASVVDLFGENDAAIVKGLLSEIVSILRNCGVMTLSVWLNDHHPWLSWYGEMGFHVRDSAPIVCVPSQSFANVVDLRGGKWFLMQGDRDS